MILLIDFGSQTTHLIARKIREMGIQVTTVNPEDALRTSKKEKPKGIILSGGPSSVYDDGAPTMDKKIYESGVPILAICYGFQLTAQLLGGNVIGGRREYGPAKLQVTEAKNAITDGVGEESIVWMSHGDAVEKLPKGFKILGSTEHVPYACVVEEGRQLYGLLFHPEVEHTEYGEIILTNFIRLCELKIGKKVIDISILQDGIKRVVGESYVIGAVSGGVDSTVAGVLTAQAIGKQFIPVYVDNGLMRDGTGEHVKRIFTEQGVEPIIINAKEQMLKLLQGVSDPEKKRKLIGSNYIKLFESEMDRLLEIGTKVEFLLQGTIYSDVIESKGTKHAVTIKSHHNVGGLPKKMRMKLLEPLREFYKDEVRTIGEAMGLPHEFVWKQVFPGPGYAVRIRGEVTEKRLTQIKIADTIVLSELEKAGWMDKVYMSFPIMTGTSSTAVKGDGRFFGEVVALRIVTSQNVMTAGWAHLPYNILQRISSRIVNEVPDVSRVVYDITTKPPATMEWE
jgi:GMP synthase (glutamine-hydrolysing)